MAGTTIPHLSPRVYEYKHSLFAQFSVTDEVLETFLGDMQEQGTAELPATLFAQSEKRECRNRNATFVPLCNSEDGRPKKEILTLTDEARVAISAIDSTVKADKYSEHEIFPTPGSYFSVYNELQGIHAQLSVMPATLRGSKNILRTLADLLKAGQPALPQRKNLTFLKPARYGMSSEAFANMHNVGRLLLGSAFSAPTLEAVPKVIQSPLLK